MKLRVNVIAEVELCDVTLADYERAHEYGVIMQFDDYEAGFNQLCVIHGIVDMLASNFGQYDKDKGFVPARVDLEHIHATYERVDDAKTD